MTAAAASASAMTSSSSCPSAFFSTDSASVFTVSPSAGVLTRAGTAGTLFTVSYTPIEYGKPVRGMLIVLTGEMQWSYEVRGMHPQYSAPQPMATKVDHVLDPRMSVRLGQRPRTNFLKKNMANTASGPPGDDGGPPSPER